MSTHSRLTLVTTQRDNRIAGWVAALGANYAPAEQALLERVVEWVTTRAVDRRLGSGESLVEHAVNMTLILRDFKLDAECMAASLLAPLMDEKAAVPEVRDAFGARVAELADGVARMAMIGALSSGAAKTADPAAQLEGLRKMLLAMVQDVRVVLVKLADHTQTMRYVVKSDNLQERHDMARLALDIFAPLANRLGVWQLKWGLEDLALRILEPQTYKRIAQLLEETRAGRDLYIKTAMTALRAELSRAGITAEISGRPKHIYSIYNKMSRKSVSFDAIYDVHALRVMVDSVENCYAVLGIVHNLWTPIVEEFDDYIAKPKTNDYQSLHTAVVGPEGKPLEIQIRTFDMHEHAELGVAAHWRYKEGSRTDADYDKKIAWLRQVVEWKDEVSDAGLPTHFGHELFADTIYVLTPQGRVIDLPKGSTPIDFAYHIHSDLGHRCRGAKVNGVMVPLNTALNNSERVEILTAKQGGPSRDWLNPALGFLKSAGARAKVRQYFNRQNYEVAVAQGRDIVTKELQRLGMTSVNHEKLAQQFDFAKLDDFLAEVARGEITPRQLQTAVQGEEKPAASVDEQAPIVHKSRAQPGGILVVGVDKLLTVPAKCCKPAPPDPIIGFVSRGRGVTIHRQNCANVKRLPPERLVEADWGKSAGATFAVDIVIEAQDRTGLLRDISEILSREHINVTATNTASRNAMARMLITVEISNVHELNRVLALLREVPGVASAARR